MKLHLRSGMATLGTVFTLILVLVVLGFSMSAASVTHLRLNTHSLRETEARQLARSGIASAISEFYQNTNYGESRDAVDDVVVKLQGTHPEGRGLLTFSQSQATNLGIAYSTNNMNSSTSVTGDGRIVPPRSLHLVSTATSGNVTRRVEALLKFTLFPQAIASAGPIVSDGPLLVATLSDNGTVDESALLPADIISNAGGTSSISLVSGTKVTGDVQSVGEVVLPPTGVDVWGEVRDEANPENIVTLDPAEYDPTTLGLIPEQLNQPSYPGPFTLEGAVKTTADLTINGDLVFNGGLLFVTGNLHVTGKLSGTGILASTGTVTVAQGTHFQAGQKVALISNGAVQLNGVGPHTSYFQGLIYTRAGITADGITVVGALVNDSNGEGVTLNDCRVFYDPDMPTITIETTTLPEVLTDIPVNDEGYVVTINTGEPPQLEYFRYQGPSVFGPNVDPDEARRQLAQQVQNQTPDATFEIPQELLDLTDQDWGGGTPDPSSTSGGQFTGPGGAVAPGRGVVSETTNHLAGLEDFHWDLIENETPPLDRFYAEVMLGLVIRGFDRRDTSWMDGTGDESEVSVRPSEFLKPNEHNRLVLWKEE